MRRVWLAGALLLTGCATPSEHRASVSRPPEVAALLQKIAGPDAVLCGDVPDKSDAIDAANACVKQAYEAHRGFVMAWGSDARWIAFAGDRDGHVTQLWVQNGKVDIRMQCLRFEVTKEKGLHCSI